MLNIKISKKMKINFDHSQENIMEAMGLSDAAFEKVIKFIDHLMAGSGKITKIIEIVTTELETDAEKAFALFHLGRKVTEIRMMAESAGFGGSDFGSGTKEERVAKREKLKELGEDCDACDEKNCPMHPSND